MYIFIIFCWAKMVCSCVLFDLYSGDCFDKVVVHFNSRFCACKFSVRVTNFLLSGCHEVHTIGFQTFFVWALLLIVHT